MATDSKLKAALLARTGWDVKKLSKRVQQKKKVTPMSTEEAAYLIAHEVGIKIDRFLPVEMVARVRALIPQNSAPVSGQGTQARHRPAKPVARPPKTLNFANRIKVSSTLLGASKLAEAKEMAELYPILYVLENSMREVVRRVMHAKYGTDWWDTQMTSGKLKVAANTAASRMKKEASQRWHQRRGADPLDYIGLDELGDIISGKHDAFFHNMLAIDVEWFRHFMKELEPSRNVLCHMNPLSQTNARDLTTKLERWEGVVAGSPIPASV